MSTTSSADSDRIDAYVWRISAVVIVGSIIANIQWVVTGYMLALAAVIPVTGWAARRYGAKPVYIVSLVLFVAGSALCGLATSLRTGRLPRAAGHRRRDDPARGPADDG